MRVLVTGASGLLGRAVYAHFITQPHEVLGLANSRADAPLVKQDLLDDEALRERIRQFSPDMIVHAAAERRPDVVEKEPLRSQELNVDVPGRLAELCKELNARLIYISTDYVFDGSKPPYSVDSEPNPLNAYGASKLLGERVVREKGQEGMVTSLRVPVLYGPAKKPSESAVNVLTTTIVPAGDGRTIKMDAYAVRYPTNVKDVARVIADITTISVSEKKQLPPILHYQATEAMTKYDMCNVMSRLQNQNVPPLPEASVSHLDPEFGVDSMVATPRPRHCKMDTTTLRDFGVDLQHTSFEEWWAEEMQRMAQDETDRLEVLQEQRERAERQRLIEEQRRQAAERKTRQAEEARKVEEEKLWQKRALEEESCPQRITDVWKTKSAGDATNAVGVNDQRSGLSDDTPPKQSETFEDTVVSASKALSTEDKKAQATTEASYTKPKKGGQPSDCTIATVDLAASTLTTIATLASSSQAETPSSPNPSFSSLRGRPTPPGTSENRSPSSSQPPSLLNFEATAQPLREEGPLTPTKREEASDANALQLTVWQAAKSNPFRKPLTEDSRSGLPKQLEPGSLAPRSANGMSTSPEADEDEAIYGVPSPQPDRPFANMPAVGHDDTLSNGYGELRGEINPKSPEALSEAQSQVAPPASLPRAPAKPTQALHSFSIKVGDPHKVGDGMTGHIVYTVCTKTDAPGFKAARFSSLRRYSDFRWLHAALVHNNAGIIIPPVPEKVRGLISRFSPDLVEARRHGLENCINKIANHPVLSKDEDLKLFLESENFSRDVKVRDARKGAVPTPEQKTWMGWSGTVGVNSGQKFHEFDEWFDNQQAYLESLEAQLKQMVKSLNALAQSRKEMADSIAASSHSSMMLSGSSLSRSLSACFAGFGDVQRRAQELEDAQSDSDVRHFGSVLYEYERVVGSVRKAFSTRVDAWHYMQKGDEDLRKARARHEKLKREPAVGHYYEESLNDLAEAENRALERRSNFELVSKRCKEEMSRFDKQRVEDVRKGVDIWLSGQLERREELLQEWINYAQRCLQLDLRDDEQRAKDREIQDQRRDFAAVEQRTASDSALKDSLSASTASNQPSSETNDMQPDTAKAPDSAEVGSQAADTALRKNIEEDKVEDVTDCEANKSNPSEGTTKTIVVALEMPETEVEQTTADYNVSTQPQSDAAIEPLGEKTTSDAEQAPFSGSGQD